MASASLGDDVFEQLRKPIDPKVLEQRDKEVNDRNHASYEKAERRQNELISINSTAPVTLSSVRVIGAQNTRHGFLERILDPLLTHNRSNQSYYTLREALTEISGAVDKLNRLDIFQQPISTYIDRPDQTDPSTTPTDYAVYVTAKERGRYTIKTGTEAGSSEGSAYVNATLRNVFGGAERLNANASLGTRTRNAYSATFDTPILSNPDLRLELGALKSSTIKPFASHEEILRGGQSRLLWQTSPYSRHDFAYNGFWRQITGLAEKASPTVRADAGDSFKSSISHTWTHDSRDIPMLPSRGFLMKTVSEIAGAGPLKGDVAFGKFEMESQAAVPIPIPGIKGDSGVSFTAGLRTGVLCPLPLAGQQHPTQSRISDRFQLGGPTDVRGFRLSGLGPRDGQDAAGGDIYAAGGASILFPLPRVGKETPLRLQAFINGGRLLPLRDMRQGEAKDSPMSMNDVGNGLSRSFSDLTSSLPSAAAGFGLVYAHPAARVEINFSLPLVIRKGEEGRKGLSFGVGLNFL
ncbi:probable cell surface homologous to bacterial outer membrane s [Lecanosticta acicola]|uniref:Probable cell surface homologous to bacterial outer membrane s n=1 Tax=Lecanosticta acicola TaxID=111012 RepID=A0AAI9E934_9PEZI|nr:probable cell surface homologous to bacterial outer membrane s [Lecanosticta acicola]